MPRTQLARMIGSMFAERDGSERLSRRAFLARGTALGIGAIALGSGALPASAATPQRIAIVGAGISGLAAALALQDKGIAATVYEANRRVGGRMFSTVPGSYWAAGQVSEWGGELIDTDHTVIQALAQRFGLPLDDLRAAMPTGATDTYYFDGHYYPYAQAKTDFEPVYAALQKDLDSFVYPVTYDSNSSPAGIALSNMTAYDWIENRVPGGHRSLFGRLLDVAYTIEFGAQTAAQTALGLIGLLGYQSAPGAFDMFGTSDERYHIRGGNQQLPRAIAAALAPDAIQFGQRLVSLAVNNDTTQTLTFTTDNGATRTVTADHTILAVPLGVMKRIDFTQARFDARKQATYAAMPMGVNGKLQLQFGSRLWNGTGAWPGRSTGASYADTGYQNTWEVSRAQSGTQGILVDYVGGDVARSFAPDHAFGSSDNPKIHQYACEFLDQIEPVYPGLSALWNGKALLSTWYLNPYSYGSYAYWPTRYCQYYAGYEGVRQGNVHFAGEHCSVNFQGYMEGGAEEGQRAAGEIIADLGRTPTGAVKFAGRLSRAEFDR
ncbi:MAG TPA: FAD-dependent oxidoreductase [Pseudonocardiaceae bacterium]|nr:FAD-dependent oxidoreductase [Pseudonocardiaceae bacterium]